MSRRRSRTKLDKRREELREGFWPGSTSRIWEGPAETGYWCAPRVLPLLLQLAKSKSVVGLDCSMVYLELLSRDFGQGLVEVTDEDAHAFSAGYDSSRGRRTWQERINKLDEAGFISVKPGGNRKIGFILIIHPREYVVRLRRENRISDRWWNFFQKQLSDHGVELLDDPLVLDDD